MVKNSLLVEKPIQSVQVVSSDISVSAEEYLKAFFPLEEGERQRKIIHLWGANYRINMWTDSFISRSFFVQAIKKKEKWSHKVLSD